MRSGSSGASTRRARRSGARWRSRSRRRRRPSCPRGRCRPESSRCGSAIRPTRSVASTSRPGSRRTLGSPVALAAALRARRCSRRAGIARRRSTCTRVLAEARRGSGRRPRESEPRWRRPSARTTSVRLHARRRARAAAARRARVGRGSRLRARARARVMSDTGEHVTYLPSASTRTPSFASLPAGRSRSRTTRTSIPRDGSSALAVVEAEIIARLFTLLDAPPAEQGASATRTTPSRSRSARSPSDAIDGALAVAPSAILPTGMGLPAATLLFAAHLGLPHQHFLAARASAPRLRALHRGRGAQRPRRRGAGQFVSATWGSPPRAAAPRCSRSTPAPRASSSEASARGAWATSPSSAR